MKSMSQFVNLSIREQLEEINRRQGHYLEGYSEGYLAGFVDGVEAQKAMAKKPEPPYPWCDGNPTREDCIRLEYYAKNPNCGE